jgi:hypothetical protein
METHSDEFNELRKLLALKRHEQPPPRYFNEFSGRVIDRIRAPEVLAQPWWQRLGLDWNLRPAMVCGLGVVTSALLLLGVVKSVQVETPAIASLESPWVAEPAIASVAYSPISSLDEVPASTAPVFSTPPSSPFTHLAVQASRVNWSLRAQNSVF